jgi:hypothetical protein
MEEARARGQQLGDAWQAALKRQIDALGELADDEPTAHDLATDLCSFWVGCWADAFDVLHKTCSACLHPDPSPQGGGGPGGGRPVIAFTIDQGAEAADPIEIPRVTRADVPNLAANNVQTKDQNTIPPGNIRVTAYGPKALLSLVELGALNLPPGVYSGDLLLSGVAIAGVRVTVNAVAPAPS